MSINSRFLCISFEVFLQFQSRHNSHTGHCYVISFAGSKRLDVVITIMKTAMFYFMSPR
jgi:hypothetical protein